MSAAEREKWERVYSAAELVHGHEPNRFLVESALEVEPGRALVIAMGEGRNAAHLARRGFEVEGIDISLAAVRKATRRAREAGSAIGGVVADLNEFPLPRARYRLVAVVHFLDRALYPQIRAALAPGGALVWETFTRANAAYGSPRSPSFLLDPGELRTRFPDLELRRYREVVLEDGARRRAVASLFANAPGRG